MFVINPRSLFSMICFLTICSGVVAETRIYDSAHISSPDHYTLLLENERVLVLKMVLKPGESDAMHVHHNETVNFERGGLLSITMPSGENMQAAVPDGHVMWH